MKKPARLLKPTPVFHVVRPRESLFTLSATQSLAPALNISCCSYVQPLGVALVVFSFLVADKNSGPAYY